MAGEKKSTSVLFGSIAVLGIPAVIYLMGYIYWTKYFSHFGVDLAKVNLPVYKVMVGATPGVYVVILGALLVYFVWRGMTRSTEGYGVLITKVLFALGLIVAAFAFIVVRHLDQCCMWVMLILAVLLGVLPPLIGRHLRVLEKLLLWLGWRLGMAAIVAVPILLFFLLEYFSAPKAKAKANELLAEAYKDSSLVRFRFASDTSFHLPDSLVLIASTESHYFVFSRTERTEGKLRVFEVNKNSVSFVEIRTPGSSSEK